MTFSASFAILHWIVYICIHNFLGSVEIAGVTVISIVEIKIKCRSNENSASKGSNLYILFAITAAGVVPCGGPKKSPRTSSIVQIIVFFRSFEIGKDI